MRVSIVVFLDFLGFKFVDLQNNVGSRVMSSFLLMPFQRRVRRKTIAIGSCKSEKRAARLIYRLGLLGSILFNNIMVDQHHFPVLQAAN